MHIHYLIHYFPPELNGGATRAADFARLWSADGKQVTVLTGFPNHPSGVIPDHYRGQLYHEEVLDGYTVRRTYIYATPNKGTYKRILNHLSLTVSAVLGSAFRKRPDIIIASSPPLFLGIAGYLLSRLHRIPLVFEVRDIWPQQAVDIGMLTNPRVIAAMERLEMFLYRKAAAVVGVTQNTRHILAQRGVPNHKIEIVPNATDLQLYSPGEPDTAVVERLGLHDLIDDQRFVVSYIGTMGLSQGLTTVLEAARQLQGEHPDLCFLMVGDGAERDKLMEYANDHHLTNVRFLPAQPRELLVHLYRLSDVALVPLRNVELFRSTIPSKLFEIMACGLPVVLGVQGEAADIVKTAHAGLCVMPESVDELTGAILELHQSPAKAREFGARGRAYVEQNYDRRELAVRYADILQNLAK